MADGFSRFVMTAENLPRLKPVNCRQRSNISGEKSSRCTVPPGKT
jgi:hypothetical protein